MPFADDPAFQEQLTRVKKDRKEILARYIRDRYDTDVRTDSIFDIQIKRIHLYKRQTLNILHILHLYYLLKDNPKLKITPRKRSASSTSSPIWSIPTVRSTSR